MDNTILKRGINKIDRILSKIQVIHIFIFSVILHFAVALYSQQAGIVDEVAYENLASSFYLYGDFFKLSGPIYGINYIPNTFYPLIISFSYLFRDNFYIVIKLINCICIGLIVFPCKGLMKDFIKNENAIKGYLFIISFLPFNNIAAYAMPESMYLFVFTLGIYYLYKLTTTDKLVCGLALGVISGILYLIKPQAISFIVGALLVIVFKMVYDLIKKNGTISGKMISYCSVFFVLFFTIMVVYKLTNVDIGERSTLGPYQSFTGFSFDLIIQQLKTKPFLYMLFGHIFTIALLYLLPVYMTIKMLFKSIKNNNLNNLMLSTIIFIVSAIIFMMVIKFTIDIYTIEEYSRLHSRYYFVIYPLLIISFGSFLDKLTWSKLERWILFIAVVIIAALNIEIFIPKFINGANYSDNIDLLGYFINIKAIWFIAAFSISTGIYYLVLNKRKPIIYILFIILTFAYSNFSYVHYCVTLNQAWTSQVINAKYVSTTLKDSNQRVVMIDNSITNPMQTAFYANYNCVATIITAPDSEITKDMIPDGTEVIIMYANYKLSVPNELIAQTEGCKIVKVIY